MRTRSFETRRLIAAIVASVLIAVTLTVQPAMPSDQAHALSGSEFDPGNIITDANFYNGSAMSEVEIQRFLENSVGGTCSNSNCLAVYRTDTPTRTWSFGTCSTYVGGSGESAARIIFKVQQACKLSAKVILVTLQKEQSLVTDRAPSDSVMRKAMGYGCPDTSSCDSTYYGFFNQIFAAGRQLTWYGNPEGSFTSIRVGQVNAIRYHPNSACGAKDVLVKNRATAALYYYTPYTPNAAALNNLGGIGDACSAYGNRNFWVFYNNWFGSPSSPVSPLASLDHAALETTSGKAEIVLSGWAIDPAAISSPIEVHVYVDRPSGTTGHALIANLSRPDVGAAYPGAGDKHGFATRIPVTQPGDYRACVFLIRSSGSALFECRSFKAVAGNPGGSLDSVILTGSSEAAVIRVSGWALDWASPASTARVDVYLDRPNGTASGFSTQASGSRPDVHRVYGVGEQHGFTLDIPITQGGAYRACAFAIGSSAFGNRSVLLGCQYVRATAPVTTGVLDRVGVRWDGAAMNVEFNGWGLDTTSLTASVSVDVYVDRPDRTSTGVRLTANTERSDIARVFPGAGSAHGFQGSVRVDQAGTYRACAYAVATNAFGSSVTPIGCSSTTLPASGPFGTLDSASATTDAAGGRAVQFHGWSIDPLAPQTANQVHVYLDQPNNTAVFASTTANLARNDVAAAYPGTGSQHGYSGTIPLSQTGTHRLCAFAIPATPFGSSALLGCNVFSVR